MIPALILATPLDSLADQNPIIVRNQMEGSASPVELFPRRLTLKRFEERSLHDLDSLPNVRIDHR